MKKHAVKIGIIASILPHIFCCGLPLTLSLIGLFGPRAINYHIIPHEWEIWVYLFSALMLVISWYLVMRDCKCECNNCSSHERHPVQKIILGCITLIFVISIVLHFFAHHH